jgi:hypothetical protein
MSFSAAVLTAPEVCRTFCTTEDTYFCTAFDLDLFFRPKVLSSIDFAIFFLSALLFAAFGGIVSSNCYRAQICKLRKYMNISEMQGHS